MPSPCGENSQCRTKNNGHAICSCLPDFIGSPPNCRPECVHHAMCAQNRACARQKCVDPCPNTCGDNARCQVVNHNPICSCAAGFTGDPFNACSKIICKYLHLETTIGPYKLMCVNLFQTTTHPSKSHVRANHHRVVPTQCAELMVIKRPAHVCPTTLEGRPTAGPSA